MSADLADAYAASKAQEERERTEAFLDLPETVAGFDLRPFTLRDWIILTGLGNAYVSHRDVGDGIKRWAEDACALIWLQSVTYKPHDAKAKRYIERRLGEPGLDLGQLHIGIQDYIASAFRDMPGGAVKVDRVSYWSFAAGIVDRFGSEYGWTVHDVMTTPLRQLWQLFKITTRRLDPKAPQFNPSDQVRAKAIRKLNGRGAA